MSNIHHKTSVSSILTLGLVSFTILSSAVLLSTRNSVAVSAEATAAVIVTDACSIKTTIDEPHDATIANGNYSGASGVGLTTLKIYCNDNAGFAIYAIGYTNDEYGNTVMHWNRASSASDTTNAINTGVYIAGTTINSTWSMKLASVAGTYAATIADGTNGTENFTTWHTVPEEYTKVAFKNTGTDAEVNGSGTGSSITLTYDYFISQSQSPGVYTGQVKYTLVHPNTHAKPATPLEDDDCPADSICYALNSSDAEGDMSSLGSITASDVAGKQTLESGATEATLISPNYKRAGYGFAGWSTDFEATNASIIYGPNQTITLGSNESDDADISTNGLILYPVWVASTGSLQGWTGCSSMTAATYNSTSGKVEATLANVVALTDTRDDNVYAVAKLTDGNCWMIENLRLDAEATRGSANAAKAQGYGTSATYGDFIGLADSEDANFIVVNTAATASTAANSIYYAGTQSGTASINISKTDYAGYRMPRYNNNNTNMGGTNSANTVLVASYDSNGTATAQWYSYGNYYSWPAAIANTTIYYGGDAGTSICPSGWKLPKGRISTGDLSDGINAPANHVGSFSYLDRMMGGDGTNQSSNMAQVRKWGSFPNNFVYSGGWLISNAYGRSSSGTYWSSSAYNDGDLYSTAFAFSFTASSGGLYIGQNAGKYEGLSIRCISNL